MTWPPIRSCSELSEGDQIEALYQEKLAHRGWVTEVAVDLGVFWILDDLMGGRRLLALSDFEVFKVQERQLPAESGAKPLRGGLTPDIE